MRKLVMVIGLALGGCASFEEGWNRAAAERQAEHEAKQAAQRAQYDSMLTRRCVEYGFPPERIPVCKMQLDAQMRAAPQKQQPTNCVVRTYTRPGGGYWATVKGNVEQRIECY